MLLIAKASNWVSGFLGLLGWLGWLGLFAGWFDGKGRIY
jgi:hypothetical protein